MNRFLTFLTVIIVLAIVRAALAAFLVGLALMLLYSFITRPRETLVFVGTLTLFGLASVQPVLCILVFGIIALVVVGVSAWQKSRSPLLLTDGGEHHSQGGSRLGRDLRE